MRRILLTLAEDTTETHCGSCRALSAFRGKVILARSCSVFRERMDTNGPAVRLPECLAAEAAAARMVEIAPEDARDGTVDAPQANREANPGAYMRVYKALRAHAAKAEVKR